MERLMSDRIKNKLILEAKRIEEDALYSFKGHHNAAESWKCVHYWVGIPTAIIAAVGSVSAFSEESLIAGILGIIVASLTALSTFLDPSGKQNNHKASGVEFGVLKNQARLFYEIDTSIENDINKLQKILKSLVLKRDELNSISPTIPRKAYLKAKKDIELGSNIYQVDMEAK